MKETTLTRADAPWTTRRPGVVDRLAARVVSRLLEGLSDGRLTIEGPFGTQTFGRTTGLAGTISVHDASLFTRVLTGGTLGAARAYVDGQWSADDLTAVCRVFARNLDTAYQLDDGWARLSAPWFKMAQRLRRNTPRGSRRNIQAHYDLGNDFFALFLDESMTYSCGIFDRPDATLFDASMAKIDRLCRKLDLGPSDHLVEIGTGWGALAIHAAATYGCRVTTATISREQHRLARERVLAAGLEHRIDVQLVDYRDLRGQYSKLVSVEMIEAVGAEFLDTFFATCRRLLAPGGRMVLQAITVPDVRYERYLRTVDFIEQDVFPGSRLVSVGAMRAAARRTGDLRPGRVDDLTPHYAETLRQWRQRFHARQDDVRRLGYSEALIRQWDLYLASCEAGFAERSTGLVQMEFDRPSTGAGGRMSRD